MELILFSLILSYLISIILGPALVLFKEKEQDEYIVILGKKEVILNDVNK